MTAVLPWRPLGAQNVLRTPQTGDLIAHDYAAWIVIRTDDHPRERWTLNDHVMVRTYGPTAAPKIATLRRIRTITDQLDQPAPDLPLRFWPGVTTWWIYPHRHYPVCADCQQPQPCRRQDADRIADAVFTRAERYSIPDHCPACGDKVPAGGNHPRFRDNVMWPLGPPVAFHGNRRPCLNAAENYARHLATIPH